MQKLPRLSIRKKVERIKLIYDKILDDLESAAHLRSDLSGKGTVGEEKITQIMCPSSISTNLKKSKTYKQALKQAKHLLGRTWPWILTC